MTNMEESIAEITAGVLRDEIKMAKYDRVIFHALSMYADARFEWDANRNMMTFTMFIMGKSGDRYRVEFTVWPAGPAYIIQINVMYIYNVTTSKDAFINHQDGWRTIYEVDLLEHTGENLAKFLYRELQSFVI